MKVLLKKDFSYEDDDGKFQTIGSGTVVTGVLAEQAVKDEVGEEIEDNAPNFNPLPGQGVAAAPFNVNGQDQDPVADQFVGQGAASQSVGTTEGGTAPEEGSPAASGTLGMSDEDIKNQRSVLQDQMKAATTDAEKQTIQTQLDALQTTKTRTTKAKSAPSNKGK